VSELHVLLDLVMGRRVGDTLRGDLAAIERRVAVGKLERERDMLLERRFSTAPMTDGAGWV